MPKPKMRLADAFWLATVPLKGIVSLTDDFKIAAFMGYDWRMLRAAKTLKITEQSEWGHALVNAAKGGRISTIDAILAVPEVAGGNAKQSWLDTALEAAATANKLDAALYLQEKGGDPSYLDYRALREALRHGRADAAKAFYSGGALREDTKKECLQNAVFSGNADCVRFVLHSIPGISPDAVDHARETAKAAGLREIDDLIGAHAPFKKPGPATPDL